MQSTVDLVQNNLNLEVISLILNFCLVESVFTCFLSFPPYIGLVKMVGRFLQVIYGDTDSIMIHSGLDDVAKAKSISVKVIQEVGCTIVLVTHIHSIP